MRRSLGLVIVSWLATGAALVGTGAASAVTPSPSVVLTHGRTSSGGLVDVLAGSPGEVVFQTQPAWQRGPFGQAKVEVLQSGGSPKALVVPADVDPDDAGPWSLVGGRLAAPYGSRSVAWWDLTNGTHGVATEPSSRDTFIGSSPDGWLYADPSGRVLDQAASGGTPVSLGVPFAATDDPEVQDGVTGPDGVVLVGGTGTGVYMAWGVPGFTTLDVDSDTYQSLQCYSVLDGAAGCTAESGSTNVSFVLRVPTNGGTPVVTATARSDAYPDGVSLTASTTLWSDADTERLYSAPAGTGTPTKTSTYRGVAANYVSEVVPAFGEAAFSQGSRTTERLQKAASASSRPTTLFMAGKSPVHAASVALTSGRVAYTDDAKHFNAGDVWSRSLSTSAGVSAGSQSQLVSTSSTSYSLSISGSTTATTQLAGNGRNALKDSLRIVSESHKTTLAGSDGQVSGDHVLYFNRSGRPYLYDVRTGHSSRAPVPRTAEAVGEGGTSVALSGDYLTYAEPDGSVWRRGISAHRKPVELSKPLPKPDRKYVFASVFSSGNYVAWMLVRDRNGDEVTAFRNAKTLHKAVEIPGSYRLDALTSSGVLLSKEKYSDSFDEVSWYLRRYTSNGYHPVLTQNYTGDEGGALYATPSAFLEQVAVSNGRIAWIDPDGVAHVARLPKSLR